MGGSKFRDQHAFAKRLAESQRIRADERHRDRIPVICERAEGSDVPDLDKKKYLVPQDLTVGQFVYVIRKRIQLPPEKAIFIFVNDTLPPTAETMKHIYETHCLNKETGQPVDDGFLYMTYAGENTFGELGFEEIVDESA